jgi:hypothetical protein
MLKDSEAERGIVELNFKKILLFFLDFDGVCPLAAYRQRNDGATNIKILLRLALFGFSTPPKCTIQNIATPNH